MGHGDGADDEYSSPTVRGSNRAADSVVTWEDSALCRMARPWLSALPRDSMEFGRTAATELTALLDGGPARTVRVPVPVPRLIGRDSTGVARGV